MTIADLIKKLQLLPLETRVIIRGYEDGYNDIIELRQKLIIQYPQQADWYYGEYTDAGQSDEKSGAFYAIELYGTNTKGEYKSFKLSTFGI